MLVIGKGLGVVYRTPGTEIWGTGAQESWTTKHRQMAQAYLVVMPMKLVYPAPAVPADSSTLVLSIVAAKGIRLSPRYLSR